MGLTGTRTYVGFGFGAIQAGLMLYEAYQSGSFGRLVVAEVVPDVVDAVRRGDGYYTVNIAHSDRLEQASVGPIVIENPAQETDRERLVEAIAQADEIGTAVPSVAYYVSEGASSLHRILAEGLRKKAAAGGPRAVVYAAENHNHAAEMLQSSVLDEIPEAERDAVRSQVRFLNTVIGKMSGVVTDPDEIGAQNLVAVTPEDQRAFLVEAFNRILISKIAFDDEGFQRGIAVFEEKPNLLPFEEAKLYGHNAAHALAAYVGALRGLRWIADVRESPGILSLVRAAFLEESGEALIRKHGGVDSLFTKAGWEYYATDLLERMTNPYLRDSVERVGRDPARKLGWDDRLIGTMRVALAQGVQPVRYALGAAAALAQLEPSILEANTAIKPLLASLWQEASPEEGERQTVLRLIGQGQQRLKRWVDSDFRSLDQVAE